MTVGNVAELFPERFKMTERFPDLICNRSLGFAAALRAQRFPVEGVIEVLLSVVEERPWFRRFENLFGRSGREFGARDQFVELVNVCLVMLAVVIFKCLRRNVWL